jgi:hypothetical protein
MSLLEQHVARFNEGVRSGDFTPMVAAFAEDAELHFEGVPVGPFVGRDAIDAAYREQPPTTRSRSSAPRSGTTAWSSRATRGCATKAVRQARCC